MKTQTYQEASDIFKKATRYQVIVHFAHDCTLISINRKQAVNLLCERFEDGMALSIEGKTVTFDTNYAN